jgi:hypothetical protein
MVLTVCAIGLAVVVNEGPDRRCTGGGPTSPVETLKHPPVIVTSQDDLGGLHTRRRAVAVHLYGGIDRVGSFARNARNGTSGHRRPPCGRRQPRRWSGIALRAATSDESQHQRNRGLPHQEGRSPQATTIVRRELWVERAQPTPSTYWSIHRRAYQALVAAHYYAVQPMRCRHYRRCPGQAQQAPGGGFGRADRRTLCFSGVVRRVIRALA